MTLLIGKQCTDGVLFLADGVRISMKPGSSPQIATGAIKALCDEGPSGRYCMVFGGHAELDTDTTRPTLAWLQDAAVEKTGSLVGNVARAAHNALADAVAKGFNQDEEQQRTEFETYGRILVFVSVHPDEWWFVEASHDSTELNRMRPHVVVTSLPDGSPEMHELKTLLPSRAMTLSEAVISCGPFFDRAAERFPERCRYPGTMFLHTFEGCSMKTFASRTELADLAQTASPRTR